MPIYSLELNLTFMLRNIRLSGVKSLGVKCHILTRFMSFAMYEKDGEDCWRVLHFILASLYTQPIWIKPNKIWTAIIFFQIVISLLEFSVIKLHFATYMSHVLVNNNFMCVTLMK